MERCVRCVMPREYPGITFNSEGVCSFCTDQVPAPPPAGKDKLLGILEKHKDPSGKYDCVIALSGGRDSTYVLYYAVRVLGLRVLAVTIDHGFLPEHTWENIRNAVRILGVDHEIKKHALVQRSFRKVLSAWTHRPSAAAVSLLCVGCRQSMYASICDVARTHGIPVVLNGNGESGVHDYFATRFFTGDRTGWRKRLAIVRGFGLELVKNPFYITHPSLLARMANEYARVSSIRLQKKDFRSVSLVSLYYFVKWDEQELMRVITTELGWKMAPESAIAWRSDCKIALLKTELYQRTLGFTMNDSLVSDLIRQGILTRAQGLERLEREGGMSDAFLRQLYSDVGVPFPKRGKLAQPQALATPGGVGMRAN